MSKNLSVIKRIKTSKRDCYRNRVYKSRIKTTTKKALLDIEKRSTNNTSTILSNIARAFSIIDKAVKQGIIHKNKGARKKFHLVKAFKKKYTKI